jgi:hypothetical protein
MFFTSLLASKWLKPVLIGLAVIAIFVGLFWGAAQRLKMYKCSIYYSELGSKNFGYSGKQVRI